MPARRIPLIWSTPKQKEQVYFKFDPANQRLVNIRCGCIVPPPPPIVVGIGNGANTLLYSQDDGITWHGIGNSIFTTQSNCAVWNGTLWVSGGEGTNSLAYSYNGINWIAIGNPSTGPSSTFTKCVSLTWTGAFWIGISGGDDVVTSSDGINWTGFSGITQLIDINILATNGNAIIGISQTTFNRPIYSTDGISWSIVYDANLDGEQIGFYTDILWDGSKFIMTVGLRNNPLHSKFYSPDGLNWTGIPNISYINGANIGFNRRPIYISRGTDPSATEISFNGTTWSFVNDTVLNAFPVVQGVKGTIFSTQKYIIICGFNTNNYIYSEDGLNWNLSNTGTSGDFKAGFSK